MLFEGGDMDNSVAMNNTLVLIECESCDHQYYFELNSLPGGEEHCLYCDMCCTLLPRVESGKLANYT